MTARKTEAKAKPKPKPKTKAKSAKPDDAMKEAVLMAALEHAPFDGFTDSALARTGKEAGASAAVLTRLFPDGALSLVEAFSEWADERMEKALEAVDLSKKKIRDRIRLAVLARIEAITPHKEAARRAGAFLTLPPHAALGMKLLYRTVDRMWRVTGDTATDFNFYTKRAILAGVYSATLMRWFNDDSKDRAATHEFLDRRIEDVMRFEKFKADVKKSAEKWPTLTDILNGSARGRPGR